MIQSATETLTGKLVLNLISSTNSSENPYISQRLKNCSWLILSLSQNNHPFKKNNIVLMNDTDYLEKAFLLLVV